MSIAYLGVKVINQNSSLSSISIPPFVHSRLVIVVRTKPFSSSMRLTSTWGTVIHLDLNIFTRLGLHRILCDGLNLVVAADEDVIRNFVELGLDSKLADFLPVGV